MRHTFAGESLADIREHDSYSLESAGLNTEMTRVIKHVPARFSLTCISWTVA